MPYAGWGMCAPAAANPGILSHILAPGLRSGSDAVGDRAQPQRVQAVAAASAVGQEHGFVFAFEPAFAHPMPTHPVRDRAGQVLHLRGGRRAGAMQARFALGLLDVLIHVIEPQHVEVDVQVERAAEALDQ